jgi:hypothetical protein
MVVIVCLGSSRVLWAEERFEARLLAQPGEREKLAMKFEILVEDYTSSEEISQLREVFKKEGYDSFMSAFRRMNKGTFSPIGGRGIRIVIHAAHSIPTDKGRKILLFTSSQSWDADTQRVIDWRFPFMLIELDIGRKEKGKGKIYEQVSIKLNPEGTVGMDSYNSPPLTLWAVNPLKKGSLQKESPKAKPIIIPPQVKAVFEKGIQTREVRQDISFSVYKVLYFPTSIPQNLYTIFILKAKNAGLGFAPLSATAPVIPEKKEEKKKEETLTTFETVSNKLKARSHIFIQFNKLEVGVPGEVAFEIYVPVDMEVDSSNFVPDKEDIYSVGYSLPGGNYLASIAIASQSLEKIGTQYYEFSIPDPTSFTDKIDTTPIFFFKSMKELPSPDIRPVIHKGYFTYSYLQFVPNVENTFSSGDYLEVFYYIFGVQPGADGRYTIEVNYEVIKGEEKVIRWAPETYNILQPFIDQPLPLVNTVLIKSESGEKQEQKSLEPGKYTLSLAVTDKISGKSVAKTIDFEVK